MREALVIHERCAARDLCVDLRDVLGVTGLARAASRNRLVLEVPLVLDLMLPDLQLEFERLGIGTAAADVELREARAEGLVAPRLARQKPFSEMISLTWSSV